ncbi:hypothetical protein BKA67DRAFT_662985 [Truncatella angustata]|uniref:Uncharacterized protein n=1 Tax=Truncatella angustata TaxID=152316 RepID=A0A9P8RM53_9PEZI|nr:uncharacterized protein BKA67DRAFT_662985 [Truncatella angustata]KAH6646576.1 hypothetical protein BKA67DRAFT_662985 [Truncatella angustata]
MSPLGVFARDDCTNAGGGNSCEKPYVNSPITGIVLGSMSGVLLVCLGITLWIFHRRRTRRDNEEWTKDPQELDDYGVGTTTTTIRAGNVKPPPQAHHHERPNKSTDEGGLGVPNNRLSVDSTQSLARQLRQQEHRDNDFLTKTAQQPRSLV